MPVHLDVLADRIFTHEEPLHHVGPNDGHIRPMQVVHCGIEPAILKVGVDVLEILRRGSR